MIERLEEPMAVRYVFEAINADEPHEAGDILARIVDHIRADPRISPSLERLAVRVVFDIEEHSDGPMIIEMTMRLAAPSQVEVH